jgi:hypothetical protein
VVVELLSDGDARLSETHGSSVKGSVTLQEQRMVLKVAREYHKALNELWRASRHT